jgi:hypothetical protein
MRVLGRAVWTWLSYDGGLDLALLCVLLGAVASHFAWQRWP